MIRVHVVDKGGEQRFMPLRESDCFVLSFSSTVLDDLSCLSKQNPHVVLFNFEGSDPEGLEAYEKLRKVNPCVPAILLSHHSTESQRVTALEQGFDDVLAFPLDERELQARIKTMARMFFHNDLSV